MHRSSNIAAAEGEAKTSVTWPEENVADWLKTQPYQQWRDSFDRDGYLVVRNLLTEEEVQIYKNFVRRMLDGEIDTSNHRHDLGNHVERNVSSVENICQIMWPSLYVNNMNKGPLHKRTEAVAKIIMGDDAAFDFDHMISKSPKTKTETPWHQDAAYWPDMPDGRSASFWVSLDNAKVENGCMWFVAGSHKAPLRPHRPQAEGVHVLTCDHNPGEGKPEPLSPGDCTLHHGGTMHYTAGNSTDLPRRAYIAVYRPQSMVDWERGRGFDHGKQGIGKVLHTGQTHSDGIQ